MTVKLHRCGNVWLKTGGHGCWIVQRELDAAGVEYELVPGPVRRNKRDALEALSGQRRYPVIEYADRTIYHAEPTEMAEWIRSGHGLYPPANPRIHEHDHEHLHEHPIDTQSM